MRMSKSLLTTHDVAYATSLKELFSKVSVSVKEKDRIGLIGNNGTGKTTFLRLLEGVLEPDSGTVVKSGIVGYVPQVSKNAHQKQLVNELLHLHGCTHQQFASTYRQIFSSVVPNEEDEITTMSGGERTKLLIAMVASMNPDILLLDEPTNHLDARSIKELQSWIKTFPGAIVFVSHNRSFISNMAQTIWELEDCAITVFGGSYEEYLEKKQHDSDAHARQHEANKKQLNSLQQAVRMRETKAARATREQNRSKGQPDRSRGAEDYFRNRSEKGIGKLKKRQDAARIEIEKKILSTQKAAVKTVNVPLLSQRKQGQLLIDSEHLDVTLGSRVFVHVPRIRIEIGDRVSISGANGVGKTLLLKTLMKEIAEPSVGITKSGTGTKVVYIDQQYDVINPTLTVFENLEQHVPHVHKERVYKQLGRFQFPAEYANKKASELSGGETARLAFAIATVSPLDLLVLDEPTNNLDIETMRVISSALEDFEGAVLAVSHDEAFLESLDITQKYLIQNGTFGIL